MSVFPLLITIVPDTKSNAISVLSAKEKKNLPLEKTTELTGKDEKITEQNTQISSSNFFMDSGLFWGTMW